MLYSVFLWRRGFREDNRINYFLLLSGFILHTGSMVWRGLALQRCPLGNLYEAMVFVGWGMVGVYLLVGFGARLRFLGAFASAVLFGSGVVSLLLGMELNSGAAPETRNGLASLHGALILLSYGAFGLSSIAGVMYVTQERDLKMHRKRAIFSLMPPIERLEKVMSRLLLAGFILLTVGLSMSPVLLKREYGVYFKLEPKLVWSLLVWAIYFGLILLHGRFAQTGRRFAWGAIGSFVFVLLTFWGVNLLSHAHNP